MTTIQETPGQVQSNEENIDAASRVRDLIAPLIATVGDDSERDALREALEDLTLEVEDPDHPALSATSITPAVDRDAAAQERLNQLEYRREKARRTAKELIRKEELGDAGGKDDPDTVPVILGENFDTVERPDEDNLVQEFLNHGGQTILYALEKIGKTKLVHDLVASLTTGRKFLDVLDVVQAPEGSRVVIVDTELEPWAAVSRMKELNLDPARVALIPAKTYSRSLDVLDPEKAGKWAEKLRDVGAWVVIFDTLGPLITRNGYDNNSDAGAFLLALRDLVAASGAVGHVVVDHESPKAADSGKGPKGDTSKTAYADQITHLQGQRGDDGALPTEYVMDSRGRAGDGHWELARLDSHFSADPANSVRFKRDPLATAAHKLQDRVKEVVETIREQIAAAHPSREPHDTRNFPSKRNLAETCWAKIDSSDAPGQHRWRDVLDILIRHHVLEVENPTSSSAVLRPGNGYAPDPYATVVVAAPEGQGTPLDLDADGPTPAEKVFGPQLTAVAESEGSDGDPCHDERVAQTVADVLDKLQQAPGQPMKLSRVVRNPELREDVRRELGETPDVTVTSAGSNRRGWTLTYSPESETS